MSCKKCSKCSEQKPINEFRRRTDRTSGVSSECIDCHRAAERLRWQERKAKQAKLSPPPEALDHAALAAAFRGWRGPVGQIGGPRV